MERLETGALVPGGDLLTDLQTEQPAPVLFLPRLLCRAGCSSTRTRWGR